MPVLMYHSISELPSRTNHPYFEIRTSPRVFRSHMQYLREQEFTTLFPSEIIPWLNSPECSARRAVCITFDDAYEDFLTAAFPVLEEFGFKSTVYVPTGLVGDTSFNGMKVLTWDQIVKLSNQEVHFGSHGVTHSDMRTLSHTGLKEEITHSKISLEDWLSKPINDFSFPFAFPEQCSSFKSLYCELLQSSGYRTGMTTIIGSVRKTTDITLLPRLPVNDYDDDLMLKAKLECAYNWLHQAQYIAKMASHFVSVKSINNKLKRT